jgi:predicted enzyme related to lactoylglutathione lyase
MTTNAPDVDVPNMVPGVPCWVDLATPDLKGARAFYSALFGWIPVASPEPEAGGYTNFHLDGQAVAGVGPVMGEGQPPAWTTYVATDDVDDTANLVEKAGGRVLMAPMDVMEYGRLAILTDPTGAAFGAWQAGTHKGAELFNVPGSLTWNELATRDPEGAKTFYGEVFGWEAEESAMGPDTYITWKLGDRTVGGMIPMFGEEWPPDLPPHWMLYFAVADTDTTVAKATELGGTVSVPPTDLPVGRFAVLGDPQGAFFSIITMAQMEAQPV